MEIDDRRLIHLWTGLAAVLSVVLACAGAEGFVRSRLPGALDDLAGIMPPVKLTGNVLATAVLRQPDRLLVYGSSELDHDAENRPDAFFENRPTGFAAFPIGKAGNSCLVLLGKVAALGEAVRGKKVAVMLSPSWFLHDADPDAVGSNLRPLQTGVFLFGKTLSGPLKQDIARRLLAYPQALEPGSLIDAAVRDVAEDSPESRGRLALLTPLGWAQNDLLGQLEFWAILRDLPTGVSSRRQRRKRLHPTALAPPEGPPDWVRSAEAAERHDRALGDASPFSVGTAGRDEKAGSEKNGRGGSHAGPDEPAARERDTEFLAKLGRSSEWADLGLLLRVLRESGAEALVISQPFNGRYLDLGGGSPGARRAYYERLEETVRAAGFPVRDFREHEEDRAFFNDAGHPSAKAWVFYDRALDEFFHGRAER